MPVSCDSLSPPSRSNMMVSPADPGDLHRSEAELAINIKKATNNDETAPKRKHVRSCIVYTWDHKSSQSFWAGMKVYVNSPCSYGR